VKSNPDQNLISILIPIHGQAPYLDEVIESIKKQESIEIEVVMVLDRPTSQLTALAEKALTNFQMGRLLISPGSGISDALNFGLNHCSGRYIARIDSDDLMNKDRLVKQKVFLDRNSEVNCIGTQIVKISESNSSLGKSKYPTRPSFLRRMLRVRNCIAHPSVMFRRDEILKIGGYRSFFDGAEDYDLWIRLNRVGDIANLDEYLTSYRVWNGQDESEYRKKKNDLSHKVRVFAEIEEIAPQYSTELLSMDPDVQDAHVAAAEYLKREACLRWKRLEKILQVDIFLSDRARISKLKMVFEIFQGVIQLSLLSLAIRFTRN